jgi:hypothetical protein
MTLHLEICNDNTAWDNFVSRSPHGSVFVQSSFLQSTAWAFEQWWVKDEHDAILAAVLIPLGVNQQPIRHLLPYAMYQGVMLAPGYLALATHRRIPECMDLVSHLVEEITARHPNLTWCLPVGFEDLRPIQWHNYHQPEAGTFSIELRYTGRIDLRDIPTIDDFMSTVRPTRRWEYRKAMRQGMVAEASTDLDLLIDLHERTFERQGQIVPQENLQLLRGLAERALADGYGEMIVARTKEGDAASATLFLYDRYRAYYLVGANAPEFRNSYSGIFAFVEGVRRTLERGLREVDVCGLNSPNRGDFKTSFNAEPKSYFVVNWEKPKGI